MSALPSIDRYLTFNGKPSPWSIATLLRSTECEAVLLLPNAFRAGLAAWLSRIPRRVGYARDGRTLLLTHRVAAPRLKKKHAIVPAVRHYLKLLEPFDLPERSRRLELLLSDDDAAAAHRVLDEARLASGAAATKPLAVFVPGGHYGSAKLWPAKHFADLADRLAADGFAVGLSVAPGERATSDAIVAAASSPVVDLSRHGLDLASLKGVITRAAVVVTNDTGTRHVAVGLNKPVVTLFGPTDPKRTTLDYPLERELWLDDVPCRPCQLKQCPLPEPQTQQCLRDLSPQMVHDAVREVLSLRK